MKLIILILPFVLYISNERLESVERQVSFSQIFGDSIIIRKDSIERNDLFSVDYYFDGKIVYYFDGRRIHTNDLQNESNVFLLDFEIDEMKVIAKFVCNYNGDVHLLLSSLNKSPDSDIYIISVSHNNGVRVIDTVYSPFGDKSFARQFKESFFIDYSIPNKKTIFCQKFKNLWIFNKSDLVLDSVVDFVIEPNKQCKVYKSKPGGLYIDGKLKYRNDVFFNEWNLFEEMIVLDGKLFCRAKDVFAIWDFNENNYEEYWLKEKYAELIFMPWGNYQLTGIHTKGADIVASMVVKK